VKNILEVIGDVQDIPHAVEPVWLIPNDMLVQEVRCAMPGNVESPDGANAGVLGEHIVEECLKE
jgi:hypothetical protein